MGSMVFEAVELPSEANPLNAQTLLSTLTRASSNNQQQVQTGTQQLQNWERQPGFFSSLQSVFIDRSLPLEIRYLALIQLKNGIDKYWRKTASNAISKEEKYLIRSRSLQSGISEPDHRLALQNAVVIAKITRLEFPHDWPDAITSVVQQLRTGSPPDSDQAHLSRALLILLYIIKELSTARLQRSRSSLQSATPEVFQVLCQIYIKGVRHWMQSFQNAEQGALPPLEAIPTSVLALKVLRRLVIAGYEFPNRHKEVREFWGFIGLQFGEMLILLDRQDRHSVLDLYRQIEKSLHQLSKLHLEMVRVHPAAFALLPDSLNIVKAYWGFLVGFGPTFGSPTPTVSSEISIDGDVDEKDTLYMGKLCLQGLLLIRACAKMVYSPSQSFKFQHDQDKSERKESIALMRSQLLTEPFIREMMETLVTRYFVFRPRDLREWETEPEEWERREDGEGDIWEFSIRLCAEKLFLDLVINNKDLLIQPLLNVFYTVATPQNTDVLLKDSIYAAIGLAAPVLENELDFGRFLESTLIQEIQIQQPAYNILRRRISIVLGQWLSIKEGLNRPLVYQIFQYFLDKNDVLNDLVVRVTAGRQLKNVIDPFEWTPQSFMPYAPTLLSRLMMLIEEVELSETKMALLNTVTTIVVRMEQHINPLADQILSLLPVLWAQAGDEYLMKQSILTILSALITSMKDESQRFHSIFLPLIQSSVEPSSESRPYLIEDACELWSAVLVQTPSPTSEIIALVDYLFPMFDTATETLRKALDITESYILLAPGPMLQLSARFLSTFAALLASRLKREATGVVTHLVEMFIRAAESLGGSVAIETITTVLLDSGFLAQLLATLRSAYDAHQTTGPNRFRADLDGVVETDHLSVLARLALGNPHVFIHAITNYSLTLNASFEDTIAWLLTEWFSHFENIGNIDRKKLHCLALTALLELSPKEWILGRLQDLMGVWTDVVTECMEYSEKGGMERDSLVYWNLDSLKPTDRPEAPEQERRRNMLFSDPVHRVNVKESIRDCLQQAINASGGQDSFRQNWLVNVDPDVIKSFGALGVL